MSKLLDTRDWKIHVRDGGRALVDLRERRDVAQAELSDATGIPKSVISRYEGGGTGRPGFGDIIKIWGAFGLTPTRAAQDFMVWDFPTRDAPDPRGEEMRAIVLSYNDRPELKDELVKQLLFTAQVFEHMQREDGK